MMHDEHKHLGQGILYENGCMLCHAIEDLHAVATIGTGVPWADAKYDEEESVRLIRFIRDWHCGGLN